MRTSVAILVMRTRPSSTGAPSMDLAALWQSARQRLATKLGTCMHVLRERLQRDRIHLDASRAKHGSH
jgi:hypothetical protein